jgi:ABC-type nitrate/sulfonate/bicarbonate transport system substrate-binding protein
MRAPARRPLLVAASLAAVAGLAACGATADAADDAATAGLTPATLVLDWTPNTNHTGIYVAQEKGWFAEHGIDLEIVQPPEDGAEALVASGAAQFGVSYQENVTQARGQEVPVVSIAAVVAHNTSGFASPVDRGIERPADYAGHVYGGWGSPIEGAILDALVAQDGGDPDQVTNVDIGTSSVLQAFQRDIDLGWVFEGWDVPLAEEQGVDLNVQLVRDYDEALDWYTPVLISSEDTIASDPELVQAFVDAATEGYEFAIDNPDEAADILLDAVPDLDEGQVRASQEYLADEYRSDSPEWGYQRPEVWEGFSGWLEDNGIIEPGFDYDAAYTNQFVEGDAS